MPPCPGTCQPTVEHDIKNRCSRARCFVCGAVGAVVPWEGSFPPADVNERCLSAFRDEHHHAD